MIKNVEFDLTLSKPNMMRFRMHIGSTNEFTTHLGGGFFVGLTQVRDTSRYRYRKDTSSNRFYYFIWNLWIYLAPHWM